MDGSAPDDKKPVRLTIFNQTFTLRVSGDPESLIQAANEVDELMTAIAGSGNMDATRAAILACLHLQDRVRSLEQELSGVKDRTRELATLLDDLVRKAEDS